MRERVHWNFMQSIDGIWRQRRLQIHWEKFHCLTCRLFKCHNENITFCSPNSACKKNSNLSKCFAWFKQNQRMNCLFSMWNYAWYYLANCNHFWKFMIANYFYASQLNGRFGKRFYHQHPDWFSLIE